MIVNDIRRKREEVIKGLKKIHNMEQDFPDGELICSKNDSRYKWYVKDQGRTSYLPKSKKAFAESLALKKYDTRIAGAQSAEQSVGIMGSKTFDPNIKVL